MAVDNLRANMRRLDEGSARCVQRLSDMEKRLADDEDLTGSCENYDRRINQALASTNQALIKHEKN